MTLLEIITKASSTTITTDQQTLKSDYPIILNTNPILLNLKPLSEDPTGTEPIKSVGEWKISETDAELIEIGNKFSRKLYTKLKNPSSFTKKSFMEMFRTYLQKSGEKIGVLGGVSMKDGYISEMLSKVGFLMGQEVVALVLEGCLVFEMWEVLETLIGRGFVDRLCCSKLIRGLIEKGRPDLVSSCVKYVSDFQPDDVLLIMKYFLLLPNDVYSSLVSVRKEWETQALMAIEMSGDKRLSEKMISLAKDSSVMLMMAHDEFSASELCLHYLVSSSNVDEVILSFCIGKLNGSEMMGLIRYLVKWLKKYERFPQACPCPKDSIMPNLQSCNWVPTLEQIVNCLGLVLDEHFLSLVMHPEFHEELRSIGSVANSLASDARLCCTLATLSSKLRPKI